ncbi:MAG: GIY-YIG nuclease family protein [Chloroflexi bacterium]|nr:GIY-YIG nuclease family protein [Chloroflexota bacterium]
MSYTIYVLRFADNSLYIGQTGNLQARLREHLHGASKGAKFTREHGNFQLAYQERYQTRTATMEREQQLKRCTRAKNEALISGVLELLRRL